MGGGGGGPFLAGGGGGADFATGIPELPLAVAVAGGADREGGGGVNLLGVKALLWASVTCGGGGRWLGGFVGGTSPRPPLVRNRVSRAFRDIERNRRTMNRDLERYKKQNK